MTGDKGMKVGIIGCGFIAEVHIQALRAVGQEVFAIVGRDREKTEEFAGKWGIPHVRTDYRDFLKVGVEAVHICTPPMLHFLPARFFLENKIPVVCEKPLCLKESEAEELKKVQEKSGTPLSVCYQNRFYPAVQKLHSLFSTGEMGRVLAVHGSYEQEFHIPPVPYSWRFDTRSGNALRAVTEIGSHVFDLLSYLLQEKVSSVYAKRIKRAEQYYEGRDGLLRDRQTIVSEGKAEEGGKVLPLENEDIAVLELGMESSAEVSFFLSEVSYGKQNHLEIHILCEKGRVSFDNDRADVLQLSRVKGGTEELFFGMQTGYRDCFQAMFSDFYTSLQEEKKGEMTSLTAALENVRLCKAIYDASVDQAPGKEDRKNFLLQHYKMELLPGEHTFYAEQYHSPHRTKERECAVSTMLGLYSATPRSFSAFHRLTKEEIWTFLEGDPFTLYLLYENGSVETVCLGDDLAAGQRLQFTVPSGVIQGGCLNPGGEYALYSCTVVPSFTADCFTAISREVVLRQYGENEEVRLFFERTEGR